MNAIVEGFVKFNWEVSHEESTLLMTKQLNLFNLILMVVEVSENKDHLRQAMGVINDNLKSDFHVHFTYDHMFVKQILNGKTDRRLLVVQY